jgi:hypothetical protein
VDRHVTKEEREREREGGQVIIEYGILPEIPSCTIYALKGHVRQNPNDMNKRQDHGIRVHPM